MDRLKHTPFCDELTGDVFLSTYDAWRALHGVDVAATVPPEAASGTTLKPGVSS
jgi:SulP family sulfate permease